MFRRFPSDQRGFILGVVLSYGFIFTLVSAGLSFYSMSTSHMIQSEKNRLMNLYVAETATEKELSEVRLFVANNGRIPTQPELDTMSTHAPNVAGGYHSYADSLGNNTLSLQYQGAGWTSQALTTGDYTGLNASTRTIRIAVTARNTQGFNNVSPVTLTQDIQVQLIPLFQFGVFYEKDLEILPGPTMTFAGPVHSNHDIYLGTHNLLSFDSGITAYGNVIHGRKDSATAMLGDVRIMNGSSVYKSMKNPDGTWLDSNDPDWITESQTRWDGEVRSIVHNTSQLKLPLPLTTNNHVMIERRLAGDTAEVQAQKFDYKAQLRIIDGQTQNANGTPVDIRYCANGGAINPVTNKCSDGASPLNPVSATTFFNFRENRTVQSTDIDVNLLKASPTFQTLIGNQGAIIYTSDRRNISSATKQDATRLVNGSSLNTNGLTVASENPVYVKGNYNSVGKKPAGIISDAFNILSGSWSDANSTKTLSNRVASNTTLQVAVITGNTDTSTGNYNGGFENIHRFLEKWDAKTLTYKGSVVVLYNSAVATGNWVYGGNFYTAPNRVWSFDTDFTNPNYNIPGFPSVYQIVKSDWEAA